MATWVAVWTTATGALLSVGTVVALQPGQSQTDTGVPDTQPSPATGATWDTINHIFGPLQLPLVPIIGLGAFAKRFLQTERENLQNLLATGTQVQKNKLNAFLQYLRDQGQCDLNDAYIQASVTLMETAGILAVGRAAIILTIGTS